MENIATFNHLLLDIAGDNTYKHVHMNIQGEKDKRVDTT